MSVIVLGNSVMFTKYWVLFKAVYVYYQMRQSEKASLSQRRLSSLATHTYFMLLEFKPEK